MTTALVGEALAAGARLESVCKELGLGERTIQRWQAAPEADDGRCIRSDDRARPGNSLTKDEEDDVVAVLTAEEFADLSPHQVVAKLADMNIYKASERTMYRLLRRRKLQRHRERSRPRKHRRPAEHKATGPGQVLSWDITYLRSPIKGQFWLLYMLVDVWSRKTLAAEVHDHESDALAAQMVEQTCQREGINPRGVVIHSDNGPAMKGKTLLAKMQDLGIVPSFSRPRVSDDNPYSEALFRTMKYRPDYPDGPFDSVEAAQRWVDGFVRWYNDDHQHSGIRFVTPAERHDGRDVAILANRRRVYAAARARRPERWTGTTRNWSHIQVVRLNPIAAGGAGAGAPLQKRGGGSSQRSVESTTRSSATTAPREHQRALSAHEGAPLMTC